MRTVLGCLCSLLLWCGSVEAQPKPPFNKSAATTTPMAEPPPTQPPPPAVEEKKPEPTKYTRDETSATIPYLLAGIAGLVVLLLICMPARRE